jgi:lipopolysaccharide/colanic/teichoic acid biosynthesis glycosyltransferase
MPLARLIESRARGIRVEDVVETYERLTGKLALELLPPSRLIFSNEFATARLQPVFERALSLLVAMAGLVVLAPLMLLIAVAIKLDSRGPVFFVQQRAGLYRMPFNLIKFRTMRPVEGRHSEWERDNSSRITRCGYWLRRFRLDELPQLINMLRGDMNLVGPRPHPMTNLELLVLTARNLSEVSGDAISYYSLRCAVRPGVTGWAQVRYRYANSLEQEVEKLRYDFYYLKHLSVWLDIRILVETVRTIVSGHRAVPDEIEETSADAVAAHRESA